MTATLVLLDNTVLSNFAAAQQPSLAIAACPGRACTTEAALAEYLVTPESHGLAADAWRDLPIVAMSDHERQLSETLPVGLGAGERTCLATASARHGILASDDLYARRIAAQHGVRITGSIGLLMMALEAQLVSIDQANTLLTAMIAAGYHSPVDTLAALMKAGR